MAIFIVQHHTKTLANGKEATVENVLEILDELKEEYPDGSPWGSDDHHYSTAFGSGIECAGYAFMVSDAIFGTMPKRIVKDFSELRPGDVIDERRADGTSVHWSVVATKIDNDGYFQVTSGNNSGKVAWGGVWWTLDDTPESYIAYTRYPD